MNRDAVAHFSENPVELEIGRSKFLKSFDHKTTFSNGQLVPCYLDKDILPGDTVSMDLASVIRMATPVYPVMDNITASISFFFVPYRLIWDHFEEFMGENKTSYWTQPIEYTVPQLEIPEGGFQSGTVGNYFGIPIGQGAGVEINALPFRAYAKIFNDWFRNENYTSPVHFETGDATVTGENASQSDWITKGALGGAPLRVNRFKDYFSSVLPEAQRGEAVALPIGGISGTIPVVGNGMTLGLTSNFNQYSSDSLYGLHGAGSAAGSLYATAGAYGQEAGTTDNRSVDQPGVAATANVGVTSDPAYSGLVAQANVAGSSVATINMLREAFATQRLYETLARSGNRYFELLQGVFGVTSPDARLQRSEFLGDVTFDINIEQVVQSSSTVSGSTPLGQVGAFSQTNVRDSVFTHSFVEHGILMGLVYTRTNRSYQNGLDRGWFRKDKLDFYWPQLANVGEMAVLNREVFLQPNTVVNAEGNPVNEDVFGFQEAWGEYRYANSMVTAEFSSNYAQSLDAWHYADDYTELPVVSPDWLFEGTENVERTLAVSTEHASQFIADFYFRPTYVRPMPLYSIPGNMGWF